MEKENLEEKDLDAIYKAGWANGYKTGHYQGFEYGRSVLSIWHGMAVLLTIGFSFIIGAAGMTYIMNGW